MSDIFISYKREDVPLAKSLAELLTAKGWTVWWDHNIPAGKDYDTIIEQELNKCRCVIVLWTAGSIQSRNVKDEANVGLSQNKLLPVMVGSIQPPLGFRMVQGIKWNDDDAIEENESDDLIYNVKQIMSGGKIEPKPQYKGLGKRPFKKGMLWAVSVIAVIILIYLIEDPNPDHTEDQTPLTDSTGNGAEFRPNTATQYYTLGISQADNERDYDKAIISFNKAINLNNNMAEAYFGRGSVYNLKGFHAEAIKDLEKSIQLGFVLAANNLAWIYFDIGNYTAAIQYFDYHNAAQPNALSEAGAAVSYFILGNYDYTAARYNNAVMHDQRFNGKFEALQTEYHWNERKLQALKGAYNTWLQYQNGDSY